MAKENEYASTSSCKRYGIKDEVGKFWVVTHPTPDSTTQDILFQTDICGMHLQYLGGLKDEVIVGFYKSKEKASKLAKTMLKYQDKINREVMK
jgi:hypothetical protein